MRKVAVTRTNNSVVKRVIVHECKEGVYVFRCSSLEDGSATGDWWYESVADAEDACRDDFGIGPDDWEYIDDPLEGCQQDWIAPVRVKGRNTGQPQWGQYERLEEGVWKDVEPS